MGIDIFFHVERREGARWERVEEKDPVGRRIRWYNRRDSDLFGVLRGWADAEPYTLPGIKLREGLPDDAGIEVLWQADQIDCEHSTEDWVNGIVYSKDMDSPCGCLSGFGHSYLTVRELLAYDWWQLIPQEDSWSRWDHVNAEWFAVLVRMAHLAGDDPDSVRCVYWFL